MRELRKDAFFKACSICILCKIKKVRVLFSLTERFTSGFFRAFFTRLMAHADPTHVLRSDSVAITCADFHSDPGYLITG
jgi:hypothetical protein